VPREAAANSARSDHNGFHAPTFLREAASGP